ncbi:hypothetical protein BpHYR1_042832, partial [Brachionus plicatilis]
KSNQIDYLGISFRSDLAFKTQAIENFKKIKPSYFGCWQFTYGLETLLSTVLLISQKNNLIRQITTRA